MTAAFPPPIQSVVQYGDGHPMTVEVGIGAGASGGGPADWDTLDNKPAYIGAGSTMKAARDAIEALGPRSIDSVTLEVDVDGSDVYVELLGGGEAGEVLQKFGDEDHEAYWMPPAWLTVLRYDSRYPTREEWMHTAYWVGPTVPRGAPHEIPEPGDFGYGWGSGLMTYTDADEWVLVSTPPPPIPNPITVSPVAPKPPLPQWHIWHEMGITTSPFVLASGTLILRSDDPFDWGIPVDSTLLSGASLNGVMWCAPVGMFIAWGKNGELYTSPDAITFTLRDAQFASGTIYDVCWSDELQLLVAVGGTVSTSPDGVTWTEQAHPFSSGDVRAICWSSHYGRFYACGSSTRLMSSPDGVTWTLLDTPAGLRSTLYIVAAAGPVVIVGNNRDIDYSHDGETFSLTDRVTRSSVVRARWIPQLGKLYVLTGRGGVLSSTDGVTWTEELYMNTSGGLNEIIWSDQEQLLLATHDSNLLMYSTGDGVWMEHSPINPNDGVGYVGIAAKSTISYTQSHVWYDGVWTPITF